MELKALKAPGKLDSFTTISHRLTFRPPVRPTAMQHSLDTATFVKHFDPDPKKKKRVLLYVFGYKIKLSALTVFHNA